MSEKNMNKSIDTAYYYLNKDYLKALQIYDNILETDVHNFDAILGKALCLMKLRNYEESIKYFKHSLDIKENYVAYLNIGIIYRIKGNSKLAEDYFNKTLKINPRIKKLIKILIKDIHLSEKFEKSNSISIIDDEL